MGTRSFEKSSVGMTSVPAAPGAAFKKCCLVSKRFDGSARNHFFPRLTIFLRAEERGLSTVNRPMFTNLSAIHQRNRAESWRRDLERKIMSANYAKLFNRRVTPQHL